MKLVKVTEFMERTWTEDSCPTRATVYRMIDRGDIPASAVHRMGRQYFIDLDKINETDVDLMVQRVLDAA